MADEPKRYAVVSTLSSVFFRILDCEKDEVLQHEVENKHGVREFVDVQYKHKAAAEYHAAKLNNAEGADTDAR